MWSWLTWLWGKASRVYNIIASFYSRIISAAINAWKWAQSAFSRAITWALGQILYYYNRAVTAAQVMVNSVIGLLWKIYNDAVRAAQEIAAGVLWTVQVIIERAYQTSMAIINGVIGLVWNL